MNNYTHRCIVLYEVGKLLMKIRSSVHIDDQTGLVASCSNLTQSSFHIKWAQ